MGVPGLVLTWPPTVSLIAFRGAILSPLPFRQKIPLLALFVRAKKWRLALFQLLQLVKCIFERNMHGRIVQQIVDFRIQVQHVINCFQFALEFAPKLMLDTKTLNHVASPMNVPIAGVLIRREPKAAQETLNAS